MIARALAMDTFQRRHLVVTPNTSWTGEECDLLVVTKDLRIIDIEIKISRADLKADAAKDKWYMRWDGRVDGFDDEGNKVRRVRPWPAKVWKHYYAIPEEIWADELAESLPSPASGVILLRRSDSGEPVIARIVRPAKPCRKAKQITAENALDIARLASIRMWQALHDVHRLQAGLTPIRLGRRKARAESKARGRPVAAQARVKSSSGA